MRRLRRKMQIIFQDPYSSLNPRMTLEQIVGEPLVVEQDGQGRGAQRPGGRTAARGRPAPRVSWTATRTPLAAGSGSASASPAPWRLNPELIVCDEPVSALDVSVQAQVLNLLEDLQAEL